MAAPPSAASQPPVNGPVPRWHGDGLTARSIRFALTVMAPIVVGLAVGVNLWVAYALLTCILGYMMDTGGPAASRLGSIAVAGAVVLCGAGLGTLARGDSALTTLVFAGTAMLYALVESSHPSAASATRFLCLTAAIGALYAPLTLEDVPAVAAFVLYAWGVSVAWDVATGMWRPSTAPDLKAVIAHLRASRAERWAFAAIVGAAVAAAFLTGKALGLEHPNWALLAIVIALRSDAQASRRLVVRLMLGTLVGVAIAFVYGTLFVSPAALMVGMTLAALVRWPAQQLDGALGLAAMAAFVVLLLQLVAHMMGDTSHAPLDRLVDITLGCGFAVAALWINGRAQAMLLRNS